MTSSISPSQNQNLPDLPPLQKELFAGITNFFQILKQINDALEVFSENFSEYKNTVFILLGAILGFICFYLVNALIAAIESIFILDSFFEFGGLGYLILFFFRYLLSPASRQDLHTILQTIKINIFGQA